MARRSGKGAASAGSRPSPPSRRTPSSRRSGGKGSGLAGRRRRPGTVPQIPYGPRKPVRPSKWSGPNGQPTYNEFMQWIAGPKHRGKGGKQLKAAYKRYLKRNKRPGSRTPGSGRPDPVPNRPKGSRSSPMNLTARRTRPGGGGYTIGGSGISPLSGLDTSEFVAGGPDIWSLYAPAMREMARRKEQLRKNEAANERTANEFKAWMLNNQRKSQEYLGSQLGRISQDLGGATQASTATLDQAVADAQAALGGNQAAGAESGLGASTAALGASADEVAAGMSNVGLNQLAAQQAQARDEQISNAIAGQFMSQGKERALLANQELSRETEALRAERRKALIEDYYNRKKLENERLMGMAEATAAQAAYEMQAAELDLKAREQNFSEGYRIDKLRIEAMLADGTINHQQATIALREAELRENARQADQTEAGKAIRSGGGGGTSTQAANQMNKIAVAARNALLKQYDKDMIEDVVDESNVSLDTIASNVVPRLARVKGADPQTVQYILMEVFGYGIGNSQAVAGAINRAFR